MKVQPAVKAETKRIAVGTVILTVLMIVVFLVIGRFDGTVLLGALLGCTAAVGNFFLMALTVQKVTESMPVLPSRENSEETDESDPDEAPEAPLSDEARQAGKKMQLSYVLRLLALGGVAALAISVPVFHPWATLIPMLFPRVVIALLGAAGKNQKEAV